MAEGNLAKEPINLKVLDQSTRTSSARNSLR
jgi:hypothetical protein